MLSREKRIAPEFCNERRQTGLNVLTPLTGLLGAVISVQFFLDGIKELFRPITPQAGLFHRERHDCRSYV